VSFVNEGWASKSLPAWCRAGRVNSVGRWAVRTWRDFLGCLSVYPRRGIRRSAHPG